MFHVQIVSGLVWGMAAAAKRGLDGGGPAGAVLGFWGCTLGTCAVFYVFFLCRLLGAGDIKLMALCTGFLGMEKGMFVIFLGLLAAAAYGSWRLIRKGVFWVKMSRLAEFILRCGQTGEPGIYPGRQEEDLLRLGPFLWAGYCLYLLMEI